VKDYIIFLILISFFIPKLVFGQVVVSEIMYDLKEGADSGREWIEVKNNGSELVDLSTWKLYEDKVNHSLNLFKGDSSSIASGGYVILADNAEKFLTDWPEFKGTVFDSSFSLKNDGETLVIRDGSLSDINRVDYVSEWGAGGDGNSLQLINGEWDARLPTPGYSSDRILSLTETNPSLQTPTPAVASSFPVESQIYAFASGDTVGVAGGVLEFEGLALGLKEEPLSNARFLWNFGDGSSKEGKKVSHVYNYPGDYIVFLDVSAGEYSSSGRMNVKITKSSIKISNIEIDSRGEFLIELYNDSDEEVNISYWLLKSGNTTFSFPRNSIMGVRSKLVFPSSLTKLNIVEGGNVDILYPNGSVFYSFEVNVKSPSDNPPQVYKGDVSSPSEIELNNEYTPQDIVKIGDKGSVLEEEVVTSPLSGQEASMISFSSKDKKSNRWIFFVAGFSLIGILGAVFVGRGRQIS